MNTRPFYFGLIFIAIIAILANYLGNTDFSHHYHISALIIAILLGMAIGNTIYPQFSTQVEKGVLFAKGTLLRTGIVLYGFRLTFGDIADVGLNAVVTDAIMLISTFFFTALLGIRYLKMDKQLVYLTGAGCSICGAAAVMAAEPVTKAESHKVSVAIAVVVIFGTLAIFTYPLFYTWYKLFFVILEKDGKEYLLGTSSPMTGFVTPPDMDNVVTEKERCLCWVVRQTPVTT